MPTNDISHFEKEAAERAEQLWMDLIADAVQRVIRTGISNGARENIADWIESGNLVPAPPKGMPPCWRDWWNQFWKTMGRFEADYTLPVDVPLPPEEDTGQWSDAVQSVEENCKFEIVVLAFGRARRSLAMPPPNEPRSD